MCSHKEVVSGLFGFGWVFRLFPLTLSGQKLSAITFEMSNFSTKVALENQFSISFIYAGYLPRTLSSLSYLGHPFPSFASWCRSLLVVTSGHFPGVEEAILRWSCRLNNRAPQKLVIFMTMMTLLML